jgi:hypothetical protein
MNKIDSAIIRVVKAILSPLGIIGIVAAIIIILMLLRSGWTIEKTTIKVGPFEFNLQKPTTTLLPFSTSTTSPIPQIIHVPIIQGIIGKEEYKSGQLILYKEIYFSDALGDAHLATYELVSATIAGIKIEEDPIQSSPSKQIIGTYVTATWYCGGKGAYTIILRAHILDKAGNQSGPVDLTYICR